MNYLIKRFSCVISLDWLFSSDVIGNISTSNAMRSVLLSQFFLSGNWNSFFYRILKKLLSSTFNLDSLLWEDGRAIGNWDITLIHPDIFTLITKGDLFLSNIFQFHSLISLHKNTNYVWYYLRELQISRQKFLSVLMMSISIQLFLIWIHKEAQL